MTPGGGAGASSASGGGAEESSPGGGDEGAGGDTGAGAGGLGQGDLATFSIMDIVVDTICVCKKSSNDDVQLQVIKALLSLVTTNTVEVETCLSSPPKITSIRPSLHPSLQPPLFPFPPFFLSPSFTSSTRHPIISSICSYLSSLHPSVPPWQVHEQALMTAVQACYHIHLVSKNQVSSLPNSFTLAPLSWISQLGKGDPRG